MELHKSLVIAKPNDKELKKESETLCQQRGESVIGEAGGTHPEQRLGSWSFPLYWLLQLFSHNLEMSPSFSTTLSVCFLTKLTKAQRLQVSGCIDPRWGGGFVMLCRCPPFPQSLVERFLIEMNEFRREKPSLMLHHWLSKKSLLQMHWT